MEESLCDVFTGYPLLWLTDVDECVDDPCPPMSHCVNAFGTYVCQCKPGYRKSNGLCEGKSSSYKYACCRVYDLRRAFLSLPLLAQQTDHQGLKTLCPNKMLSLL